MIGEEQEKLDLYHRHFQDEDPAGVNMQPVLKSCLKRLFDHGPFTNVLSCSISEKPFHDMTEFEPIFIC